jgi:signal transduction histidine kinase
LKVSRSLIGRLIGWQAFAMGCAWSCLLTWLILSMMRYEDGDLDQRMTYFAQILAETASSSVSDPEQMNSRIEAVEKIFAKGIIEKLGDARNYAPDYQVWNSKNELLYRSKAATIIEFTPMFGGSDLQARGESFRFVHVQSNDKAVSVAMLEANSMRRASMIPLVSIMTISQVLIFLVCIAVLWWVARTSFKPVQELAQELRHRKTGDLRALNDRANYQEIAPFIQEVNSLFLRESKRLTEERHFLADAAHELKTPLAAIAAQAHLLLQATSEAARISARAQLMTGLDRASHLMTQLLNIARADSGLSEHCILDHLDLVELARQCLVDHVANARIKAIELQFDSPESVWISICKQSFCSIIDNLVDNAVRYTPDGGSVSIELSTDAIETVLTVKDSGPGIPESLREKVFERFYRVPGVQPSGSGLGLSIVEKLAATLGAKINLKNRNDMRGLMVSVSFINKFGIES